VDLQPVPVGEREDLDQPDRVLREEVVLGQGEPAAVEHEAVELARASAQRRKPEAAASLRELLVEMGEEHSGQVANRFGVEEIMAHEALDRRRSGPVRIFHTRGELALVIEGEALLGAARDHMEVAPYRPKKTSGALELAQFGRGKQAGFDQFGDGSDAIGIFTDPEERVEIAQAAFAFLDIRFDDVAAVAHALVPRVALGEFVGHEGLRGAGSHFAPEAGAERLEQGLVAPQIAHLEKRGPDRLIADRGGDHLIGRAAAVPDLESEIPEQIEQCLRDLLGPGGRLVGVTKARSTSECNAISPRP
jgi:hypothetical protein